MREPAGKGTGNGMDALTYDAAAAMRVTLEAHFADQGYEVAWDGVEGPRTLAFPSSLPHEIWEALTEERERVEIPQMPGRPRQTGFVDTSGPPLRHENRDGAWSLVTYYVGLGGKLIYARDVPALREAGRVIVPLALIPALWEDGHGIARPGAEAPADGPAPGM